QAFASWAEASARRAIIRRFAFVRRLARKNRTFLCRGDGGYLSRATFRPAANIQVVADEQQERFSADEFARAEYRVAVAARGCLLDKMKASGFAAGSGLVSGLVTGANHDADLLDPGRKDFVDQYS